MTESRIYHILCVGDSRLARIQPLLNNNLRNLQFTCHVFSGASLGHIAYQLRLLLDQTTSGYYDYIAVIAGICDLTYLERHPRYKVSLMYNSVESTIENFERLFALCRTTIRLFTDAPVIFASIPGIHLNFYSRSDAIELYHQQSTVDTSIPLINIIIKRSNMLHGLPTLDIAKYIHRSRGHHGKYKTRYCRLYDGCHPDEITRQEWASEILKVFTNFIYAI